MAMNQEVMVPERKVGLLIGKGGETIRKLQEETGAKIVVSHEEREDKQKAVQIYGSKEQVQEAAQFVKAMMRFKGKLNPGELCQEDISVGSHEMGKVIGRGGANIRDIRSTSGAVLEVLKEKSEEGATTIIRIFGRQKNVNRAKEMLEDLLNQESKTNKVNVKKPNENNSDQLEIKGPDVKIVKHFECKRKTNLVETQPKIHTGNKKVYKPKQKNKEDTSQSRSKTILNATQPKPQTRNKKVYKPKEKNKEELEIKSTIMGIVKISESKNKTILVETQPKLQTGNKKEKKHSQKRSCVNNIRSLSVKMLGLQTDSGVKALDDYLDAPLML